MKETIEKMESALAADPSRVVVVCISGWRPSSHLMEREQQKQRIIDKMKKEHEGEESFKNFDFAKEAEKYLQAFGSSKSGMEILKNKFAQQLCPRGVPANNIILADWTENSDWDPTRHPRYGNLLNRINGINPSYLAIIGHSYGACTATRISGATNKIPDFVGLVDTIFAPVICKVPPKSAPQNSDSGNYPRGNTIYNWYQCHTYIEGYAPIAGRNGMHVDNMNMSKEKVDGERVDHSTISQFVGIHNKAIEVVNRGISLALTVNTDKSIFFGYKNYPYPALLATFGVRENKSTGPRIATALEEIAKKYDQDTAIETAHKFEQWSKGHNRHFNNNGIHEFKEKYEKVLNSRHKL